MRRTEELFALASANGIEVVYDRLRPVAMGLYLPRRNAAPLILLDVTLQHRERWLRATLAHELGHHTTGSPGWLALAQGSPVLRARCEAAAQRWALEYLMPEPEVWRAIRAGERVDELAERFWVPESWAAQRLAMLLRRIAA